MISFTLEVFSDLQSITPMQQVHPALRDRIKTKYMQIRSPHGGTVVMNPTSIHEDTGSIPGLAQWVKDPALHHELWCRSHTQLGPQVAVAVV